MSTLKELYKEQIEAYSAAMTADEREDARQRILDILEMRKRVRLKKHVLIFRRLARNERKLKLILIRLKQKRKPKKLNRKTRNASLILKSKKLKLRNKQRYSMHHLELWD